MFDRLPLRLQSRGLVTAVSRAVTQRFSTGISPQRHGFDSRTALFVFIVGLTTLEQFYLSIIVSPMLHTHAHPSVIDAADEYFDN